MENNNLVSSIESDESLLKDGPSSSNESDESLLKDGPSSTNGKRKADSETSEVGTSIKSNCDSTPPKKTKCSDDLLSPLSIRWQSTKEDWKARNEYALRHKLFCDVDFVVGQGAQTKTFSANKVILSMGSPIFSANFSGDWSSTNSIEVPDVEPEAFSSILRFLYYDHVEITADTAVPILYASRKYDILPLEKHAVKFLMENLSLGNLFSTLCEGKFFEIPCLIDSCFKLIDNCTETVIVKEEFRSIDFETLVSILQRDTLRIKEFDLLQATLRWASAEFGRQKLMSLENRISIIKKATEYIRVSLIPGDEILSLLADSELLSVLAKTEKAVPRVGQSSRFSSVSTESQYSCKGSEERGRFCVDEHVQLIGVRFFGGCEKTTYKISVHVYECEKNYRGVVELKSIFKTNTMQYDFSGLNQTFSLMLTPVELHARTLYEIMFKIEGPDSFSGIEATQKVIMRLPGNRNVKMFFTSDSGQLPELLFQ